MSGEKIRSISSNSTLKNHCMTMTMTVGSENASLEFSRHSVLSAVRKIRKGWIDSYDTNKDPRVQ